MKFIERVLIFFRYLFCFLGFVLVFLYSPIARDDTDPGKWGKRSGLRPFTDGATGCIYLATNEGSITPRLDKDGKHKGCRQ